MIKTDLKQILVSADLWTLVKKQNHVAKLEFSHYIFTYFCSFLVYFVSYLSLKQFTKSIFCWLVLQFPAALIGKN